MPYQGSRVAVTGATGFVGSHLVERLVRAGANVKALANYNSRGSIGALRWVDREIVSSIDLHYGDIRDPRIVRDLLEGVETVFHLAAVISVPYSYESPRLVVEVNVMGTLNVMEAARDLSVSRVVHTSTSEVYGTPDEVPITESHPLKAQSPYAASKIAADKLCESFHRSYDLPAVILRPFNTFGPRQSVRAIVPTIVTQAISGDGTVRLGNLDPVRDLVYVEDTAKAFLAAGSATGIEGQTIQVATGEGADVRTLVREVGEILGQELRIEQDENRMRPESSEVLRLIGDPSRIAELLGWKPDHTLKEGIRAVVDWFRGEEASDHGAGARYV